MEIFEKEIKGFEIFLKLQERSEATIRKYLHDVRLLAELTGGYINDKADVIRFKKLLIQKGYAVSSINSMLAAVNRFLEYLGVADWKVRFLKVQRTTFMELDLPEPAECWMR